MLKRLTNNWTLKLTSMVLAVALWSHVRGEVNPWETMTVRVPLRANPPRNVVLSADSKTPATIRVTLRGPRSSLRQLKGGTPANPLAPDEVPYVSGDQVRARLDFPPDRKGRQKVPVVGETMIEDVEVVGVMPPNVDVMLDRAERDDFTVRPQFEPASVEGLRLSATSISPQRAAVFGPSALLSRVAMVRALADDRQISPGALRLTRVPVVALDENERIVEGVQVDPQFVQVTATVREIQETRQVRVALRLEGEPATGFQVSSSGVSPNRLTLSGPARTLRQMASLRVALDVAGVDGNVSRRVVVPLPVGVRAAGSTRVTASATITRGLEVDAPTSPEAPDRSGTAPIEPDAVPTAPRSNTTRRENPGRSPPTEKNARTESAEAGDLDTTLPARRIAPRSPRLPAPAPHP